MTPSKTGHILFPSRMSWVRIPSPAPAHGAGVAGDEGSAKAPQFSSAASDDLGDLLVRDLLGLLIDDGMRRKLRLRQKLNPELFRDY